MPGSRDNNHRKIMIMAIVLILSGCVMEQHMPVLMHVPEGFETLVLDFSSFTERGFLFTPRSYSGKYNSIGMVEFKYNVEARLVCKNLNAPSPEASSAGIQQLEYYDWDVDEIDYQVVLEHAYKEAQMMGGNAIVNFKMEVEYETLQNAPEYPDVVIPVVHVTGFVIERYYPYHTEPLPDAPTE